MNKQELFEKALNEFDEWPYDEFDWENTEKNSPALVFCIRDCHDDKAYREGGIYTGGTGADPYYFNVICTREEFEAAKTKRSKKFTKEFNVRGGTNVPEVWQPCEVLFSGTRYIVVKNENGREFSRRKAKIKIRDIDKRTDKEKAVDDIVKTLNRSMAYREAAEIIYDKWVGDKK